MAMVRRIAKLLKVLGLQEEVPMEYYRVNATSTNLLYWQPVYSLFCANFAQFTLPSTTF